MTDNERYTANMTALIEHAINVGWLDGQNDPETDVVDLLADLMHYCDSESIDFNNCLRIAENHFNEEVEDA